MNRGTAMKWIELLDECSYEYDNSQLGFLDQLGNKVMSPLGVLCEFLNPIGMETRMLLKYGDLEIKDSVCDGEVFTVSPTLMKRGKIKSPWMEHVKDGIMYNIYDALDEFAFKTKPSNKPFSDVIWYIEQNYQQF